ncbi:mannose/glucose-specific lectin-like [Cornus florida]|uniref:mannose/glucose-specific lectin-like n=1 Tax=Cornus florida TaxID=4283 RepID=UPI00289F812D|nr:mannose/glucose-specific lectin-like [Cornus florida]
MVAVVELCDGGVKDEETVGGGGVKKLVVMEGGVVGYSMANAKAVTFGPYGSKVPGNNFDHGTSYSTIREIIVCVAPAGTEIESFQVVYSDIEGKPVSEIRRGGGGGNPHSVKLDYPKEYLISISGTCGSYAQYLVVKSLTFHSNIKQYGPYGKQEGSRFVTPSTAGKIVGFFGRSGARLDAIGVHMKPIPTVVPVGPFGTTHGEQWDDGNYSTVRELIIHSGAVIDCFQVVYDNEGKRVMGEKHGTVGGQENKVTLDYPNEFLLSVWGYFGQVGNMVVIRSLGFQSNKRTIGPFGVEDGQKFQFPSASSACAKIIGFHGRSDKYLTAIGVYLDK